MHSLGPTDAAHSKKTRPFSPPPSPPRRSILATRVPPGVCPTLDDPGGFRRAVRASSSSSSRRICFRVESLATSSSSSIRVPAARRSPTKPALDAYSPPTAFAHAADDVGVPRIVRTYCLSFSVGWIAYSSTVFALDTIEIVRTAADDGSGIVTSQCADAFAVRRSRRHASAATDETDATARSNPPLNASRWVKTRTRRSRGPDRAFPLVSEAPRASTTVHASSVSASATDHEHRGGFILGAAIAGLACSLLKRARI